MCAKNLNSKADVAGHPIHPMLVHFPIALWMSGLLALLGYLAGGSVFWYRVASVGFIGGSAFALLAAIPGMIDLFAGISRRTQARRTGLQHMALNPIAVVLFTAVGFMMNASYNRYLASGLSALDVTLPLVLSVAGALITFVSGALGSKLVHKEHVGQRIGEYPVTRTR